MPISENSEYPRDGHALSPSGVTAYETPSGGVATRTTGGIEVVFPPDTRQRIDDTTRFPWSAMGQLVMDFPDGNRYTGTATLIDHSHVLTAAHNVYGADIGGWAQNVWYVPGRNGDVSPFGSVAATRMFITEDYYTLSPADPNATPEGTVEDYTQYTEDYAVVRLREPLNLPIFGMYPASDVELHGRQVRVAGYPGDKRPRNTMWTAEQVLEDPDEIFLFYTLSTYKGESGAAILASLDLPVGPAIVGVHVAGDFDLETNFGVRLTSGIIRQILAWMNTED